MINDIYRMGGTLWKVTSCDRGTYTLSVLISGTEGRWNRIQYMTYGDILRCGGRLEND
jgi:hypothetical protein